MVMLVLVMSFSMTAAVMLHLVPVLKVEAVRADAVVKVERVVLRAVRDAVGGAHEVVQVPVQAAMLAGPARHAPRHEVAERVDAVVARRLGGRHRQGAVLVQHDARVVVVPVRRGDCLVQVSAAVSGVTGVRVSGVRTLDRVVDRGSARGSVSKRVDARVA